MLAQGHALGPLFLFWLARGCPSLYLRVLTSVHWYTLRPHHLGNPLRREDCQAGHCLPLVPGLSAGAASRGCVRAIRKRKYELPTPDLISWTDYRRI
jgi:hypothetical protein